MEGLRQTASRLKKESSDIKAQQERLPQKKEQLEKTQKKAEELDRKCRQLAFEISRDSELGTRAEHVKEEETKCYAQIKSLNEDIKTAKTTLRLPDIIAAEIIELEAEIENLDTLKLRLQTLLDKKEEADKSKASHTALSEELKELDKEISELTRVKATSRASAEHLKQYAELRDKADKIRRLQSEEYAEKAREAKQYEETLLAGIIRLNDDIMKNFGNISISDKKNTAKYQELSEKLSKMKTMFKKYQASAVANNNASKYDFVLSEALESIEAKIEEMNLNPEIKLLFMQDKRKELQARIKQEQAGVKSGTGLDKQIAKLQQQIEQAENAIATNRTKERLRELKSEEELTKEMLANLDIDDTISALEYEISNLAQNLSKLQNEKRRLANIKANE